MSNSSNLNPNNLSRLSLISPIPSPGYVVDVEKLKMENNKLHQLNEKFADQYNDLTAYNQNIGEELIAIEKKLQMLQKTKNERYNQIAEIKSEHAILSKNSRERSLKLTDQPQFPLICRQLCILLAKRQTILNKYHREEIPLCDFSNVKGSIDKIKRKIVDIEKENMILERKNSLLKSLMDDNSIPEKEKTLKEINKLEEENQNILLEKKQLIINDEIELNKISESKNLEVGEASSCFQSDEYYLNSSIDEISKLEARYNNNLSHKPLDDNNEATSLKKKDSINERNIRRNNRKDYEVHESTKTESYGQNDTEKPGSHNEIKSNDVLRKKDVNDYYDYEYSYEYEEVVVRNKNTNDEGLEYYSDWYYTDDEDYERNKNRRSKSNHVKDISSESEREHYNINKSEDIKTRTNKSKLLDDYEVSKSNGSAKNTSNDMMTSYKSKKDRKKSKNIDQGGGCEDSTYERTKSEGQKEPSKFRNKNKKGEDEEYDDVNYGKVSESSQRKINRPESETEKLGDAYESMNTLRNSDECNEYNGVKSSQSTKLIRFKAEDNSLDGTKMTSFKRTKKSNNAHNNGPGTLEYDVKSNHAESDSDSQSSDDYDGPGDSRKQRIYIPKGAKKDSSDTENVGVSLKKRDGQVTHIKKTVKYQLAESKGKPISGTKNDEDDGSIAVISGKNDSSNSLKRFDVDSGAEEGFYPDATNVNNGKKKVIMSDGFSQTFEGDLAAIPIPIDKDIDYDSRQELADLTKEIEIKEQHSLELNEKLKLFFPKFSLVNGDKFSFPGIPDAITDLELERYNKHCSSVQTDLTGGIIDFHVDYLKKQKGELVENKRIQEELQLLTQRISNLDDEIRTAKETGSKLDMKTLKAMSSLEEMKNINETKKKIEEKENRQSQIYHDKAKKYKHILKEKQNEFIELQNNITMIKNNIDNLTESRTIIERDIKDLDYRNKPGSVQLSDNVSMYKDKLDKADRKKKSVDEACFAKLQLIKNIEGSEQMSHINDLMLREYKLKRKASKWKVLIRNQSDTLQTLEKFSIKNANKRKAIIESLKENESKRIAAEELCHQLEWYRNLLNDILTEYNSNWCEK